MSLHSDISDFNFRSKYFISYNIFSINLYLIHIRYLFLRFPAQQCVINRNHEERDDHTCGQTADIYDRQTLCCGTAASDCQCHRNHREDGCHTCHQNRPDTGRTCLNERCPQIHRGAILVDRIHVENTVIYNSSDTYSSGVYQKFAEQAKTLGLDIVAAEAFTADSKTDFSVQLQKAKDAGAELVFLPIYYQEASLILAQANKMGFAPKWFGCDGMDGLLALDGFDAALAENLMFLTPFTADAEDEATQKFVSDFEAAFKGTPNQFAADAYDCVYVIKEAAEKAELTPDMSVSDMSDALKKAMTEIKVDRMTGKSITWSEDGEPTKDPTVVIVQGGVYKILHAE